MTITTKGWIFIGLNGVRFLSIVSMILVFASSILVLVNDIKAVNRFTSASQQASSGSNSTSVDDMLNCDYIEGSTVPNQPAGAFWAVLNRLLIIAQVLLLTLSELGWPMKFFETYFPVLGNGFGVGALGVIQCLLGAAVLSHRVDDFALVSAFLLFSVGCLNIVVGLIFRERVKHKRSMQFWNDRFQDLLPTATGGRTTPFAVKTLHTGSTTFSQPHPSHLSHANTANTLYSQHSRTLSHDADVKPMNSMTEKQAMFGYGYGFGRHAEKAAESRTGGILLTRPLESVPPYAPRPRSREGKAPSRSGSPPPNARKAEDEDEE